MDEDENEDEDEDEIDENPSLKKDTILPDELSGIPLEYCSQPKRWPMRRRGGGKIGPSTRMAINWVAPGGRPDENHHCTVLEHRIFPSFGTHLPCVDAISMLIEFNYLALCRLPRG